MFTKFDLNICRLAARFSIIECTINSVGLIQRQFYAQARRFSKINSVIFDFDGVILDTETIFFEANSQVFKRYGAKYTNELKIGQMGRKLTDGTEYIIKETGLGKKVTVEEYIKQYNEILDTLFENIPEMPGARKFIEHLHKHHVQMSICTGSTTHEFLLKTRKYKDIVDKFPLIILAGDDLEVKHGKPSPDPYLVTMQRLRPPPIDPKSVLVFEDSMNGVLSAASANNTVVWIPQERFKPKNWQEIRDKIAPKCAEILFSMEEFDPAKYGLPAY